MILISAKIQKGFYRCAVYHPAEQVEHTDDAFTPEQLAILQAEPMLSVVIVPEPVAQTTADTKTKEEK